ncbi:MAG TPA: acyltransferase family protein [Acidimicrobiales bacterium]|nr:acyltransferase family protein [Acidimicrobiales bacterium]
MDLGGRIERTGRAPTLVHVPGLDGLRALAVLSVMAYHAGFSWIPGGFHGVDTFFVLSGYLITSLLIVERQGTGTVRFGRFWARRARRLLPALFVLVGGLGVLHLLWPGALVWPDPLGDAASTLGYVANWHFVAGNASYFAPSFPSPLLHTWSLAIEEQFYLVWPLLVFAVLGGLTRFGRREHAIPDARRRLPWLGLFCGAGALASAAWMWILTPAAASPDRAYYGTDTRAQALLVGATLAVVLELYPLRSDRARRGGAAAGVAGLLGGAALWALVPETSSLAFHGGFFLASLASAAVVVGLVVAPSGAAARLLSLRPLRYVGTISYGVYLWYWPVALVMTPQRIHLGEWPLFVCRTAVTLGIAALSARVVELPIRRGAFPARRALVGIPAAAAVSLTLVALSVVPASPVLVPTAVRTVAARPAAATTGPPVSVLLVGDSMAGSLGASLAPEASAYGVRIINEGQPGCAVSTDSEFQFLLYKNAPGPPCRIGRPDALLDQWKRWVDRYRPDVVVYLGRVDLMDQDFDGSWTSIGSPPFDRFLQGQLRRGVSILGSRGARVVLLTSPYYDSTVQTGGVSVPEDAPGRVTDDDRILAQVASSEPGVTVFPFGNLVTPGGRYRQEVDGVDMRCDDGVHFSAAAGEVVAPRLLPVLVRLGHTVHLPTAPVATSVPAAVPSWYGKLQCGQP